MIRPAMIAAKQCILHLRFHGFELVEEVELAHMVGYLMVVTSGFRRYAVLMM